MRSICYLLMAFCLASCASLESDEHLITQASPRQLLEPESENLRGPIPWEKSPRQASEDLRLPQTQPCELLGTKPARRMRSPDFRPADDDAKFGYRDIAKYRKAESVQAIEEKAASSARREYSDKFDPRDMTTYQQYSRHHWSNIDRRPLGQDGSRRGRPWRPLK